MAATAAAAEDGAAGYSQPIGTDRKRASGSAGGSRAQRAGGHADGAAAGAGLWGAGAWPARDPAAAAAALPARAGLDTPPGVLPGRAPPAASRSCCWCALPLLKLTAVGRGGAAVAGVNTDVAEAPAAATTLAAVGAGRATVGGRGAPEAAGTRAAAMGKGGTEAPGGPAATTAAAAAGRATAPEEDGGAAREAARLAAKATAAAPGATATGTGRGAKGPWGGVAV